MAANWIKWTKGFADKREVRVLARKLNVDVGTIVVGCFRMWEWADDETSDGHVKGAILDDIDSVARVPGLAACLASDEVGWIRVTGSGITFVNFDRHNGETAKSRALDSKRKQLARKDNASGSCPISVRSVSGSDPDTRRTRAEQSREEKKIQADMQPLEILDAIGVEEPARSALLKSDGISSALLCSAWTEANRGQSRRPVAVFVSNLKTQLGFKIPKRKAISAELATLQSVVSMKAQQQEPRT